jgi:hypothetical protein
MAGERHVNGMACVNKTRPHYVNQMGKTQSKALAERQGNGRETAWEQHGKGMLCVNRPSYILSGRGLLTHALERAGHIDWPIG